MKINITNWCTDGDVIDVNYRNGWTMWNTFTMDMYHEYQFRYGDGVQAIISIKLYRKANSSGHYVMRGENFKTGKASNFVKLFKEGVADKSWIIYQINEIIKELEK
jgi:UTP-glucose-1-phosphate uridylyltransferase